MQSRVPLFALLLTASFFVVPLATHAAIPFFGPIIPEATKQCALSWGALVTVINNIISLLITLAIVFVAPLMIAWAGFLFVVNPVNASGKEQAKKILLNTVVGIVIALAGWLIVDAIMAVLYDKTAKVPGTTTVLGTWSDLIGSRGILPCIDLKASLIPTITQPTVVTACPISPLSPITDSIALQMEGMGGKEVVWTNTNPQLQKCANTFIGKVGGGTITSAYRPWAYQTHLWEIKDRWCTQSLKSNSDSACSSLKSTVSAEVTKHQLSACGAVSKTVGFHGTPVGASIGIDISLPNKNYDDPRVISTAKTACLVWANYPGDPVHYNLDLAIPGCKC